MFISIWKWLILLAFFCPNLVVNAVTGDNTELALEYFMKTNWANFKIPIKYNNSLLFLTPKHNAITISSMDPGYENFTIPIDSSIYMESAYIFGNGKILIASDDIGKYLIIDPRFNSSSPVVVINKDYHLEHPMGKIGTIVTYENTFDVFDWYQKYCLPCRFNDKGESINVTHPLNKEPTGIDPKYAWQHSGYSLTPIQNFGNITDGYLYTFKYTNYSTAVKLLDDKFQTVRQRLIPQEISTHSIAFGNLSFCYKLDACSKGWYQRGKSICQYAKCELLDSDLNTLATVKMHDVNEEAKEDYILKHINIHNLPGGGAMVALDFRYHWGDIIHSNDVYIQRINADGQIDEPMKFGRFQCEQLYMHDFVYNNGQYCLNLIYWKREDRWFHTKCTDSLPSRSGN